MCDAASERTNVCSGGRMERETWPPVSKGSTERLGEVAGNRQRLGDGDCDQDHEMSGTNNSPTVEMAPFERCTQRHLTQPR